MQVDRQPSPWPAVAMLVGLLLFCLAAPYYWQHEGSPSAADSEFANQHGANSFALWGSHSPPPAGFALPGSRFEFGNVKIGTFGNTANGDSLNLWNQPTIEDLVAACSTAGQFGTPTTRSLGWPQFSPTADLTYQSSNTYNASGDATEIQPSPYFASAFVLVGELMVEVSPSNIIPDAVSQLAEIAPIYFAGCSHSTPMYTSNLGNQPGLRMVGPGDRLAMRPAPPSKTAWCVPQALFEQLQRLSEPAYTAPWASHVSNQLHALTEREQLDGDDVQSILADLSDAAQEALRMAANTDNDVLRVELLRAHWGLARRLDCWAAIHDERVASRASGRVAARGELSPYFDSSASAVPVDVTALTKDLEAYEKTRDPQLGRLVVQEQRSLAASEVAFDRALADAMEQHYRNANIRVAITAEMLNRMIGAERNETRPIRDRIAGAFVQGQSDIRSESRVQLAPSDNEWKLELQTTGVVNSNTYANAGPVRLRSVGATEFSGTKTVIVDQNGVRLQPSDVEASSSNRLVGVTTDYDWVPLFRGYARNRAMQEYRAKQGLARSQIESRVMFDAEGALDRETHEALETARQKLYDRFADRFNEYGIKVTTVEMKSTPERLVARVRVAGEDQLGSHTPRPRALSDSLASVQVHESAMSNLAVTLGLDGKRFTAPELQATLRERFPQLVVKNPPDARHDTVFQFAPKDAVQFRIADSRLELLIAFANVELEGESMPDVTLHAFYTPAVDGLKAELVRDGALGVEGRISSGERARLHNIFTSMLPPERRLPLVSLDDTADKRFRGLMVTQLVLEDGWIGLAIGPESTNRVAERVRSLR